MEPQTSCVKNTQTHLTVSKILHICVLLLSLSVIKICIKMQRPALTDQSHINTINQADTLSSDIWNAVIKNVNTASFGKKENLSGDQIRISRIHSRKKLRRYKKVIPVTGGRGIVLVLRGAFWPRKEAAVNL